MKSLKPYIINVIAIPLLLIVLTPCCLDRSMGYKAFVMQEVMAWIYENSGHDEGNINLTNIAQKVTAWDLQGLQGKVESIARKYKTTHQMNVKLLLPPRQITHSNICSVIVVMVQIEGESHDKWVYGKIDFSVISGEFLVASAGTGDAYDLLKPLSTQSTSRSPSDIEHQH
jgi:hypothetical protein